MEIRNIIQTMFETPTGKPSTRSWEAVQVIDKRLVGGAAHLSRYPSPFTARCQIRGPVTIQFRTFTTVVWFQLFAKSFQIHITILSTTMSLTSSDGTRRTKPAMSESMESCTRRTLSLKLKNNSSLHPMNRTVTYHVALQRSCSGRTQRSSPYSGALSFGHFTYILVISRSTFAASQAQIYALMSPTSNL